MDNLLVLAYNLVELSCKILALNHIFSTLYDKHREFHVLDQVDQPKSKQTEENISHRNISFKMIDKK